MTIVMKEFNVPIEAGFLDASKINNPRGPMKIRVFWDNNWNFGKRDSIVFFSGGTGLNEQNVNSARVTYAISLGFVYIDTMSNLDNYYIGRNVNFPNTEFHGSALDVPAYLKFFYNLLVYDVDVSRYFKSDTKLALLGHSRGAGCLIDWLQMAGIGSPQAITPFDNNVKGVAINSPMGSGAGGYPAPDRVIRYAGRVIDGLKKPIIYTVGAGDITHTTRPMMILLYNNSIKKNPMIDFRVVGNNSYGHEYPTNTTNGIYQVFLNFGREILLS